MVRKHEKVDTTIKEQEHVGAGLVFYVVQWLGAGQAAAKSTRDVTVLGCCRLGAQQNILRRFKMSYRVHRFEINMERDQVKLEQFLNSLKGEIISIIPNIAKTTIFQIYGVTRKVDFLLIVEKT